MATRENIEQTLMAVEGKAAMLRYLTETATTAGVPPDAAALSGMSETCEDIETAARLSRRALPADVLDSAPTGTPPTRLKAAVTTKKKKKRR